MNNELPKDLADKISHVFPQEAAANLVKQIVSKRPSGWSSRSNSPYYTDECGKQMREVANRMIETGEPVVYSYDIWCAPPRGMSQNTLYTRINQSIRYLVERLDPNGLYRRWYDSVAIERNHKRGGIIVQLKTGVLLPDFAPRQVEPAKNLPNWKRDLDNWLESDEMKPFNKERLCLTIEEINQLKLELSGLKSIMFSVDARSVKVIKTGA